MTGLRSVSRPYLEEGGNRFVFDWELDSHATVPPKHILCHALPGGGSLPCAAKEGPDYKD